MLLIQKLEFIGLSEKAKWLKEKCLIETHSVCVCCVKAHKSMLAEAEREKNPCCSVKEASLFPWELKGGFPSLSWVLWESDTNQLGG